MRSDAGRHLVAILVLLLGIGLSVGARHMRPDQARYEPDFSTIPLQLAEMEGEWLETDEELKKYLEADVVQTLAYGEGREQILANVIYGASWRTVHSPAQCYPAAGWLVAGEEETIIPTASTLPHAGPVMGTLMRASGMSQPCWCCSYSRTRGERR